MPCISGLVVEYVVAIDVTRVRFPADAVLLVHTIVGHCYEASTNSAAPRASVGGPSQVLWVVVTRYETRRYSSVAERALRKRTVEGSTPSVGFNGT